MYTNTETVVLICDSRGRYLEKEFESSVHRVNILIYSGAKLYRAIKLAESEVKRINPDQIYILAGINNLTYLNKNTRKVSLSAPEQDSMVQQYCDEMNFSYSRLRKITKPGTKVIFAPLTGMDLAKFNRIKAGDIIQYQNILNSALLNINNRIIQFNTEHGIKTPWTHAIIHRRYRGVYHFSYERLQDDGCHLTEEIRIFWGQKLVSAISANSEI